MTEKLMNWLLGRPVETHTGELRRRLIDCSDHNSCEDAPMTDKRISQADRLLRLLAQALVPVELPRIMALGIASHTRRISDLRKRGYNIVCEKETVNGQVRTKYRLVK